MSAVRLRKYLENIDNQKPVNLIAFRRMVGSLNLNHRFNLSDIESKKAEGAKYFITHIHPDLLDNLRQYAAHAGSDRISAACQNNSHSHKVVGSYLLVVQSAHSLSSGCHPIVVLFDEQGRTIYPSPALDRCRAKNAVLIENRQLLIQWRQTIAFLQSHCGFACNDFDVIFAAGNEISNSFHKQYLSRYQKLYFCFDIDLGGVVIAKNLINLLPDCNYEFVMPMDINDRLSCVTQLMKPSDVNEIKNHAKGHAGLNAVSHVIGTHFKRIEQESFLHE